MKSLEIFAGGVMLLLMSCHQIRDQAPIMKASLVTSEKSVSIAKGLDKEYWYDGKAELSTYDLQQNRYNDIHDGKVVCIFVTEDFLTDKHVKNDSYTNKNSVPILKLNQIRRFTTGIYDYSIMTSVFTRADGSGTDKITMSSQDWCGQSFVQLNKSAGKYKLQMRSYFESEGDQSITFKADVLEDELMNLIRIDPAAIPVGEVKVLPSLMTLRLKHLGNKTQTANLRIDNYNEDEFGGDSLKKLVLDYTTMERRVEIVFESSAPHEIVGWKEITPSVFDKKKRSTIATKNTTIQEPYWSMNKKSDESRREGIGL